LCTDEAPAATEPLTKATKFHLTLADLIAAFANLRVAYRKLNRLARTQTRLAGPEERLTALQVSAQLGV